LGLGAWGLGLGASIYWSKSFWTRRPVAGVCDWLRLFLTIWRAMALPVADHSDIADIRFAGWHSRELGDRRAF
jgi:hypothetical protein